MSYDPSHRSISRKMHSGLGLLAGALLCSPVFGHGGQYRGPGETAPPSSGTSGSSASSSNPGATGSSGSSTTGPAGAAPVAPPSSAPTASRGAAAGGRRGISLGPDFNQWQFWWEYNKEPFLDRRGRLATRSESERMLGRGIDSGAIQPPSQADRRAMVAPLLRALREPKTSPDIASSCMIALARIGIAEGFVDSIEPFLSDPNQEKRETAALALGIAGLREAVPILQKVASGEDAQGVVDVRTRSFALYGFAAGIDRHADFVDDAPALQAKFTEIALDLGERRDVRVAAIHALTSLAARSPESGLRRATQSDLTKLLETPDDLVAAHAAIAIGRVLAKAPGKHTATVERFLELLEAPTTSRDLRRSLCIAIGQIASYPEDVDLHDRLRGAIQKSRDLAFQRFGTIALGQIGGRDNLDFLVGRLDGGKLQQADRVWTALALGVLGRALERDAHGKDWQRIATALTREFDATRQALPASGIALALGMIGAKDAGPKILEQLQAHKNDEEAAGYFALALGLLSEREHREEIRKVALDAARRELLVTQGSIALGLLEDPDIVESLTARLRSAGSITAKSSLARGLGFLGDRRSLPELVTILDDPANPDLARAFAAVAIGLACDSEPMPWNARFAAGANYHAYLETLVGGGAGILDIL